jgi:hypothetical protein
MTEYPILFNREMILALHAGRKTQTRRIVNPQPWAEAISAHYHPSAPSGSGGMHPASAIFSATPRLSPPWAAPKPVKCPFGEPGDSLWVREAWRVSEKHDSTAPRDLPFERGLTIMYDAGGSRSKNDKGEYENDSYWPNWHADRPSWAGKGRPSIHMPRAASRTSLEVTRIRVERLQAITEQDAEDEGVDFLRHVPDADETLSARDLYRILWDTINDARGFGWNTNPWVWVVEFPCAF